MHAGYFKMTLIVFTLKGRQNIQHDWTCMITKGERAREGKQEKRVVEGELRPKAMHIFWGGHEPTWIRRSEVAETEARTRQRVCKMF